jgi:hypothetical protein
MSEQQWKSWRFVVIHFAEPVPCHECKNLWGHPWDNMTIYGIQQFGAPFERDIRSICPECAARDVARNQSIPHWVTACKQIVDESAVATLMGRECL